MKITNTTKGDLGILPEVVVPAGGTIEPTKEQADEAQKNLVVCAWVDEGMLEVEKPAKAKSEPKASPKAAETSDGK